MHSSCNGQCSLRAARNMHRRLTDGRASAECGTLVRSSDKRQELPEKRTRQHRTRRAGGRLSPGLPDQPVRACSAPPAAPPRPPLHCARRSQAQPLALANQPILQLHTSYDLRSFVSICLSLSVHLSASFQHDPREVLLSTSTAHLHDKHLPSASTTRKTAAAADAKACGLRRSPYLRRTRIIAALVA